MKRWHEQRGGKPGLANRFVHLENPLHDGLMMCGRDAYGDDMAQINRSPINCPSCQRVILACKAVSSRWTAIHKRRAKGARKMAA